jgi:RHS repeat-associated protein
MREYVYLNKQLLAVLDYAVVQGPVGKEVIVDNGNPPAGWVGKSSNKDYGEGYLYSTGGSGSRVRWTPVLEAGEYEVYVWYVRNPKNSNSVQYTVMHDSQSDAVPVDQTVGGGAWQLLDRYSFNGTGNEYIEVSDSSGGTSADAVRFVKVVGDASAVKTTVSYVHNDHLGTPRVMTDESGRVVWRALYDPFGNATVDPLSTRSLNARFPGQYFDSETGLHYNYYRYYNPVTGRYLTSDPIGLAGGLNTFSYVANNPVQWMDMFGLDNPGCDGVPDTFESICMLNMCSRHDLCYFEKNCSARSWLIPFSECNYKCNIPAVLGAVEAMAYAVLGHECELERDLTPRVVMQKDVTNKGNKPPSVNYWMELEWYME